MVSKNNSQKRVNRKNKLTRRRVSNSSSKKRTNKRNKLISPSPNKSKKRHSKKKSRKRTTNKTSKKRRKSKNLKNTKANNVLMKGGSKLFEALLGIDKNLNLEDLNKYIEYAIGKSFISYDDIINKEDIFGQFFQI